MHASHSPGIGASSISSAHDPSAAVCQSRASGPGRWGGVHWSPRKSPRDIFCCSFFLGAAGMAVSRCVLPNASRSSAGQKSRLASDRCNFRTEGRLPTHGCGVEATRSRIPRAVWLCTEGSSLPSGESCVDACRRWGDRWDGQSSPPHRNLNRSSKVRSGTCLVMENHPHYECPAFATPAVHPRESDGQAARCAAGDTSPTHRAASGLGRRSLWYVHSPIDTAARRASRLQLCRQAASRVCYTSSLNTIFIVSTVGHLMTFSNTGHPHWRLLRHPPYPDSCALLNRLRSTMVRHRYYILGCQSLRP